MIRKTIMTALCVVAIGVAGATAQPSAKKSGTKETPAAEKPEKKKGPEDLSSFVKADAKIMQGMTTVYEQDDKYFINVNDSLMGRDILMVSRVAKSAEGIRGSFSGYAGDQIGEGVFYFEKGPGDKIYLKTKQYRERAEGSLKQNLENSSFHAIVASFDIAARCNHKGDNLIDFTSFLLSESEYLFFSKGDKQQFNLGNVQKDKSYIEGITTYPINTECKVVYTYSRSQGDPTATYMLNASFLLLPDDLMTPRYFDERVGYFTERFVDFDKNPQRVENTQLITRWRLEPKDMEAYKRGELVEPVKPIVFYIDPDTPEEWVPYLIAGVNDWQAAFERAGFKNAIIGKRAPTPEEDPSWTLEDARYSAIVYKPSNIANASGPHVADPRTGEILESHVNWYHNVMSLLRNWYFIQCSPSDPAARNMTFDTELMGQLVRFVSSHEVGHTLGLRHNFIGSNTDIYTAENLRNVNFLREHGHATSIMDYCRFNYVAQPGDNIPQELLFPEIGEYDKWAIEWGYRLFPQYNDPKAERAHINNWIIEKIKDPVYVFGTESDPDDPREQREDCGHNHMESNAYGVSNLQYIMAHIIEWTSEPNQNYSNLSTLYNEVNTQYARYMNHVAKWIGGVYSTPKTVEQEGNIREFVERSKQKEAMEYLNEFLFEPQMWLIPSEVLNKTRYTAASIIGADYTNVLGGLVSRRVLGNMYADELQNGSAAYTMEEFFKDLTAIVWSSESGKQEAALRRELQTAYVDALAKAYASAKASADVTDVTSMLHYQLKAAQKKCGSLAKGSDTVKAHYNFLADKIENALNAPATQSSASAASARRFSLSDYYEEMSRCWEQE